VAADPITAAVRICVEIDADTGVVVVCNTTPMFNSATTGRIQVLAETAVVDHDGPLCSGLYELHHSVDAGMVFVRSPRKKHAAATRELLTETLRSTLVDLREELSSELEYGWRKEEPLVKRLVPLIRAIFFDRLNNDRALDAHGVQLIAVGNNGPMGAIEALTGLHRNQLTVVTNASDKDMGVYQHEHERAQQVAREDHNIPIACFDPTGSYYDALLHEFQEWLNELWERRQDEIFDTVVRSVFTELSAAAPTYGIEDLHAHLAPEVEEPEADETAEEPEAEAKPTNGDPTASEPEPAAATP